MSPVPAWRETCKQAHAPLAPKAKADRTAIRTQKKEIKRLEMELRWKEKALAEAAALLVLQKKVRSLWEEPEAKNRSCGALKGGRSDQGGQHRRSSPVQGL